MIRIAICDDSVEICAEIEQALLSYAKMNGICFDIDIFYCSKSLNEKLNKNEFYDLVCLDIEIDNVSGIELGKLIREELKNDSSYIVYISSYKQYAMDLFTTRPFNFLIKPINKGELYSTIDKLLELLDIEQHTYSYKKDKTTKKILIKEILYFEAIGRQMRLVTKDREIYYYEQLKNIEKQLNELGFISPHRSYLVNYRAVLKFNVDDLIMLNGDIVPISRGKKNYINSKIIEMEEI